jgi:hypothetical protein
MDHQVMADNGAASYVNGVQITNDLTSDHEIDPINWNSKADIPAGTLVAGTNIIAVAVRALAQGAPFGIGARGQGAGREDRDAGRVVAKLHAT